MAEFSYFWTTNAAGTGDQVAAYTQAQLAQAHSVLAACAGFEGVAPGLLNELACTDGGANTVDVATGGAVVDGKPYSNTAVVNVNVPSAVGGGNTRIDRIVLRCSWAGYSVRITRIAGTDAGSPTAPAITQTSGTTYDIQLCRVLVDTAGAVTVTDERVYAAVGTTGIQSDAVTTAKIINDAVDDTKVGNRVPQFYRRQGGSATIWSTQGTTNYTPGAVRMQAGVVLTSALAAGAVAIVSVTFPTAFSYGPIVIPGTRGYLIDNPERNKSYAVLRSASTTQAIFWVYNEGTHTQDIDVYWLAIGPE